MKVLELTGYSQEMDMRTPDQVVNTFLVFDGGKLRVRVPQEELVKVIAYTQAGNRPIQRELDTEPEVASEEVWDGEDDTDEWGNNQI